LIFKDAVRLFPGDDRSVGNQHKQTQSNSAGRRGSARAAKAAWI
jgi:hypothetical protein